MKKSKPVLVALFSLIALALTGCGKSNGNVNNGGQNIPYGQAGYGQPGQPGVGGALSSQCVPLNGPIPFQGSMIIDSANVYAGQGVGGNGGFQQNPYQQASYGQGAISMQGSGSDGWVSIQAQMVGGNLANAGGQIQLSPLFVQSIMYRLQSGGYGQPGYGQNGYNQGGYGQAGYGQLPCAQVIGINLGHYNTKLYGGQVILSINGQPVAVHF